jgi:GT2 family glycosyltransferase/serine/threonine protein kinase
MDLSIIIVNWNTKKLVLDLLNSVKTTVKKISNEIIIVDNASTDGSVEEIRKKFPSVKIIENQENLGFAKANNQALKISSGKYALLLNSDTILLDGVVDELFYFMEENKDIGIAGVQLINPEGKKQNSFANEPTLLTELFNKSILKIFFPNRFPSKRRKYDRPIEVESIIGACMMVRRKAFEEVGLLDEDYFFFFEETDWCLRMRRGGWKVCHIPHLKIIHLQGQSAAILNPQARIEYFRSRYTFFRKHRPRWKYPILVTGLVFKLLINLSLLTIVNILTLFKVKKNIVRWNTYLKILWWHMLMMPDYQGLKWHLPNLWIRQNEGDGTRWIILRKSLPLLKGTIREINGIAERVDLEILNRSTVRLAGILRIESIEGTERLFVKRYRHEDLFSALRFFIFGSNARREWFTAERLLKLGIPTFKPLAFGEKKKGAFILESFLIAEAITESLPLDKYLEKLKEEKTYLFSFYLREIIHELASILGNMHLKGVFHRDLHAGNILISERRENSGYSLYLIDLHRAKVIKKISRKRKLFNLATLFLSLHKTLGKEEKRYFLDLYGEIQKDPIWKSEGMIEKIESLMEKIRFYHYMSRQRRCLKKSTLFDREVKEGYTWYWRKGFPIEYLERIIHAIRSGNLLNSYVLKSSKEKTIVLWPLNMDGTFNRICVKIYKYRGIIYSLKYLFRRSKAMRYWVSSHGLRVRGVLTPDVIALVELRKMGRLIESFLFMEDLSSWKGIDNYIRDSFSMNDKRLEINKKRAFIKAFANKINYLHTMGIYHKDLKASNILVREGLTEEFLFSLIDLDDVEFQKGPVEKSKRIYNLAQINASIPSQMSSTDRLRFLLYYMGDKGLSEKTKSFARKVIEKSKKRAGAWPYARPHPFK